MNDIVSLSLEDQISLLEKKKISSYELTSSYLKNIEEKKDLNCFISINESALEQAKIIDDLKDRKSLFRGFQSLIRTFFV